jgi:hypothetical protein
MNCRAGCVWIAALSLALASAAPALAPTAPPDWNAVAAVREVEVLTRNEDGSTKETTVWLAVADGQGYIRTGNTSWWKNVERTPEVTLRIEGAEHPLRVELVPDPATRARVAEIFRQKYGASDRILGWFRGSDPHIMHLVAR